MTVINGTIYGELLRMGAACLMAHRETVNGLNVFPVPDGDTGTNMSMTMEGIKPASLELPTLSAVSASAARDMMRAARGNSGVILSLFFRGMAKVMDGREEADTALLLAAVQEGARSAAAAVEKPVEGTILTVMRECAAGIEAPATVPELLTLLYERAEEVLKRTPDMLPALKRARVVDSGGFGFVRILEGMKAYACGEELPEAVTAAVNNAAQRAAADFEIFDEAEIKFSFCTECLIDTDSSFSEATVSELRARLSPMGDSMVLTWDGEMLKVHIHTNEPLTVLGMLYSCGTPRTSKVENMKIQHSGLVTAPSGDAVSEDDAAEAQPRKKYGIFAVSPGDGFNDVFKGLGTDVIISGGQSMNPSADDILKAIESCPCENAIVLTNNGNIILAAEQAAKLAQGTEVVVLPTRTLPQGISALFAFNESRSPEENAAEMRDAIGNVASFSVTRAVRDADVDGLAIKKHQYLGLAEGKVKLANDTISGMAEGLAELIPECDCLTVYYGKGVKEAEAQQVLDLICARIGDRAGDASLVYGGQPVYSYVIAADTFAE